MEKWKICVVSGSRAEYGLLKNVIRLFLEESGFDLRFVVTGTHLCEEFGYTLREIIADGFIVDEKIPCVVQRDDEVGVLCSLAKAMEGFAEYFSRKRPDILVVLGDRYEIFACVTAAAVKKIPIAHLYGGDITEGAVDEFFRHSITKMSYLHFVSNEDSRKRVIQLGEDPKRVFNVGAIGAENVANMELLTKDQLEQALNCNLRKPYGVVTFHPVTLEEGTADVQADELFAALEATDDMNFIITKANADSDGRLINEKVDHFVKRNNNCVAYDSLGSLKYLSAVKYAKMVIGNSSSGIYEAPLFGIPTVNIGDRQKGRLQGKSIINCKPIASDILGGIEQARNYNVEKKEIDSPYFKQDTSKNIVEEIKRTLANGKIDLKKKFYDLG